MFCPDPATQGLNSTATYDEQPTVNFAALNAGDSEFFVGGALLNKQFETDLRKFGGQRTEQYQEFHEALFRAAEEPRKLYVADQEMLRMHTDLQAGFLRVVAPGER